MSKLPSGSPQVNGQACADDDSPIKPIRKYTMKTFVNTRNVAAGTQTVLSNVTMNWVKVTRAVPAYNGGNMQFELQIATTDKKQAEAWKTVMPNINVTDEGAKFVLKRPAFRGRPHVVDAQGAILSEDDRNGIGNGSVGDIRIAHNAHPKTGVQYVTLEAVRVTEMVTYVPEARDEAFDF